MLVATGKTQNRELGNQLERGIEKYNCRNTETTNICVQMDGVNNQFKYRRVSDTTV